MIIICVLLVCMYAFVCIYLYLIKEIKAHVFFFRFLFNNLGGSRRGRCTRRSWGR